MDNIVNDAVLEIPPVGENLKRERMARNLSLGDLAKGSGISKGMLSQIESGKVNPTLVTLWKAAHAMNMDIGELIGSKKVQSDYFCKLARDQQARIVSEDGKTQFLILSAPDLPAALEMYHMTLLPGALHCSEPHEEGCREFLLVHKGKVRVKSGENAAELSAGDFLAYRGDLVHSVENLSSGSAELHLTDFFPER